MSQYSCDVCIIGGGPSGYAAAMRALDFGLKTILVEKDRLGGAGVYDGALTSKTWWELSREVFSNRQRAEKYFQQCAIINFQDLANEVKEAIYERKSTLTHHLFHLQKLKGDLFQYLIGTAQFLDPHHLVVSQPGLMPVTIQASNIVMATGSRPRKLPHLPIDEVNVLTSDGISQLQDFPDSLVILGAGVIGCEFATIFSNMGRTQVRLICREERILCNEDPDISAVVEASLLRNGVIIHKQSQLQQMKVVNGRVQYEICVADNVCEWHEAEKALVSVGRIPNTDQLNIEVAGVKLKQGGYVDDDDTRTSVPHIYAVGDITADISLVNVGELEGRHAIELIAGYMSEPICYNNISTIMFLNPEIAGVGMNELQAQKAGIPYRLAVLDYSNIARAIAMRNTKGFFKILVTDGDKPKILGMRAAGEHASSAIQAVALMIGTGMDIHHLADMIHPHPSIVEGVQEAMRMLLDRPIMKDWYPNPYHRIACWNPGDPQLA